MRVKPNTGLQVRDPITKQLIPDEGIEVSEFDVYWAKRLRDKDVVLVIDEPVKTKNKNSATTA